MSEFVTGIRAELMRVSVSNGARIPFSTAFFSITAKCPLRCPHCYEWENLSSDEKLTYEDLLVILRKLQDYGTFHFQLSGGEPLERLEALLPLVSLARREADVWINTSGFGLTREVAHSLKEAGLTGAEISLDHWEEKEHNHFRKNPESFGWVLKAVENCNAEGILTSLSLCATSSFVTRENLDRYIALAMSLGISIIRILDARVTAWFKGDETILTPGQTALLEEYYRGASSPDRPPAYPLITYPGYHARMTGCTGGGNRYIYIDPKGDIHPCPFCRRPSGNAVTDSLDRVVEVLKSQGCKKYGIFSGN